MNSSEANIKIENIEFSKAGSITFTGTVENVPLVLTWNMTMKDFEKILPKSETEFEYKDSDDLCNAVLDSYNNLHWLMSFDGYIRHIPVNLEPIIEEALYELYINTQ